MEQEYLLFSSYDDYYDDITIQELLIYYDDGG